jgi:hypothetical protein
MAEISDLPAGASVVDTDLFLMYLPGEASNKSRKVTRAIALAGVVRETEDADLGVVDADELNAPLGAIDALTVATSITLGAILSKILTNTASVAFGTLAAGASADVTMTVTGAVTGDVAIVNPQADIPDGLCLRSYVSASNTITINVTNASTGSISGASYSLKAVVLRVA